VKRLALTMKTILLVRHNEIYLTDVSDEILTCYNGKLFVSKRLACSCFLREFIPSKHYNSPLSKKEDKNEMLRFCF
jgi:hypothetical protein